MNCLMILDGIGWYWVGVGEYWLGSFVVGLYLLAMIV